MKGLSFHDRTTGQPRLGSGARLPSRDSSRPRSSSQRPLARWRERFVGFSQDPGPIRARGDAEDKAEHGECCSASSSSQTRAIGEKKKNKKAQQQQSREGEETVSRDEPSRVPSLPRGPTEFNINGPFREDDETRGRKTCPAAALPRTTARLGYMQ
ncbi:hypothetical protein GQ53DRAFT_329219 [Thozetella sp. PMI_491]|nr:hypothetical protein GQ53DRAFT_329219 [Thozetella sp. PMI_491]